MMLPDFSNSLLNLTASICLAYGHKTKYETLPHLDNNKLKDKKNIILLVVDGMGYNFFQEFASKPRIKDCIISPITSVFPSTTAVAITSILTGLSPQEHALTGWFVYLKELGSVSKILPLTPRYSKLMYFDNEVDSSDIYDFSPIINNFEADSYFVHLDKYKDDHYQKFLRGNSTFKGFNDLTELSDQITSSLNDKSDNRKFIYSYWNGLDSISHYYGCRSKEAINHFEAIETEIEKIINLTDLTDTALIITADHGFTDVPDSNKFRVNDIPGLRECLILPLMGEPRNPYCYLRLGKEEEFKEIWEKHLSPYSSLFHIDEMIENKIFGFNAINSKFTDRVGDYLIMMNDNYALLDNVMLEKEMDLIGYHGGTTQDEMLVPLIYIG